MALTVVTPLLNATGAGLEDSFPPLRGTTVIRAQGGGHAVVHLDSDTAVLDAYVVAPTPDAYHALVLARQVRDGAYPFYAHIEGPDVAIPYLGAPNGPWPLSSGDYDLYVAGPENAVFEFRLILENDGTSTVETAPWWARAYRLRAATEWLGVAFPGINVVPPAAIDRAIVSAPSSAALWTYDRVDFGNLSTFGAAVGASVFRLKGPGSSLDHQSCSGAGFYYAAAAYPIQSFFELATLRTVQAGTWQVGVDFAAAGNFPVTFHRSVGIAYALAPTDATSDVAVFPYVYANTPLGIVPERAQVLSEHLACTALWEPD